MDIVLVINYHSNILYLNLSDHGIFEKYDRLDINKCNYSRCL